MKIKNLKESYTVYSISNREHEKEVDRLIAEYQGQGWNPWDSKYSGSKYYVILARRGEDGKGEFKAIQYSNQLFPRVIDINYKQAQGYEPIDDFDGLRRELGRKLLPRRDGMNEDAVKRFYVTVYAQDSKSGPEEGGYVTYGWDAISSKSFRDEEAAKKYQKDFVDGAEILSDDGRGCLEIRDEWGDEYKVCIEPAHRRGRANAPARSWAESELDIKPARPYFDRQGKRVAENPRVTLKRERERAALNKEFEDRLNSAQTRDEFIDIITDMKYRSIRNDHYDLMGATAKRLTEAKYGGAFDIADDQYFTREDINKVAEDVVDHINETFLDQVHLGGCWFDNGKLIVNVQDDDFAEYEESVVVDMRKIKSPSDLSKYTLTLAAKLIKMIKEYNRMNESKLNETSMIQLDQRKKDLYGRIRSRLGTTNLLGTRPQWTQDEVDEDEELSTISMIQSICAYAPGVPSVDDIMKNRYMKDYIGTLGEEKVREIVERELAHFSKATVRYATTDSEGVSYNTIDYPEDMNEDVKLTPDFRKLNRGYDAQALADALLKIDGIVDVDFDLDAYGELNQVIVLTKYDIPFEREDWSAKRRELKKSVFDTAKQFGLVWSGDRVEDYGEWFYFVFHEPTNSGKQSDIDESILPRNAKKIRVNLKNPSRYNPTTAQDYMNRTLTKSSSGNWEDAERGKYLAPSWLRSGDFDVEVLERDDNYKPTRTREEYVVQGRYGSGWEDLTASENYSEARADLKAYRENETQYEHRLITRRVPITEAVDEKKDITVKEFYLANYEDDEIGADLNDTLTFDQLYKILEDGDDVYTSLGVGDSIVRERVFSELARRRNVKYDKIYYMWLDGAKMDEKVTTEVEVGGWWAVDFDITFEGEEVYFDSLSETTQEHIADSIGQGYQQGEIVEDDGTGWWVANIECYLDDRGDVFFDSLDEASQEHIVESIKDGYTNGELCAIMFEGKSPKKKALNEVDMTLPKDMLFDPSSVNLQGLLKQRKAEEEKAKAEAERKERIAQIKAKFEPVISKVKQSVASGDTPSDTLELLFEVLVPREGKASTTAGEIVRAMMRIIYRWYNDGDRFYESYGLEVCGGAAAFLYDQGFSQLIDGIMQYPEKMDEDDAYEKAIEELCATVIDEVIENVVWLEEENLEDILDYDATVIEENQPKYDFEISVSDSIELLLDNNVIDSWDCVEYIKDALRAWTDTEDADVSRPWGHSDTSYTIEDLTKDGLYRVKEWVKYGNLWASMEEDYADDIRSIENDEFDDDIDEPDEE